MLQNIANKVAPDESTATGHQVCASTRVPSSASARRASRFSARCANGSRRWQAARSPKSIGCRGSSSASAAFLRFFFLGMKPPHFDEGINGWFVDQMVKNGFYRYDPTNYHGPLHFYVLFFSQTLFGRNIWALRLPVVLVSIVCVWLTLKFEPFVRRAGRPARPRWPWRFRPVSFFTAAIRSTKSGSSLFSMLFILGLLGLWQNLARQIISGAPGWA